MEKAGSLHYPPACLPFLIEGLLASLASTNQQIEREDPLKKY
ncbi:hypothetical protein LEAN103870_05565 [Legionella anisa]|uniref:Uncharacterized protein n=3 Tax=Legionellaceae TaxID=444 RepID=A0A377IVL8_9GAMM|nr:hypothetical protein lpari_03819 [Legionella parisiensis]QMT61952.1 hypothetical protein HBNCFIEN_03360 [Legionella sp. PC997]SIR39877.1 hypothetical protein SAMN05421777_111105 [Fluoribacter gormanii]STX92031.1 Uncharacterised protein [Legionella gratiana]STO92149.1 Uncharacterised protein [Fluoribacter gormanii]